MKGFLKDGKKEESSKAMFAIIGYMLCSSLMLLSNKLAVHYLPAPSFVLWSQLALTACGVWIFGAVGVIVVDPLEWGKTKAFSLVALIFLATIYTNIKTLQYSNVETFIVFRASTPLIIAICDWIFLGNLFFKTTELFVFFSSCQGCFFTTTTNSFCRCFKFEKPRLKTHLRRDGTKNVFSTLQRKVCFTYFSGKARGNHCVSMGFRVFTFSRTIHSSFSGVFDLTDG